MNEQIELQVNQPLLRLMRSCETYCVAACCGVDAFDLSEAQVGEWVSTAGLDQAGAARRQLQTLLDEVKVRGEAAYCDAFFAWPSAQECVAWLDKWKIALDGVLKEKI